MNEKEERKLVRDLKQNYFITVIFVYLGIFLASYFIVSIFLMILQAHPYVNLLFAILLMLIDILVTDRIINHYLKDRWIQK